MTLTIAFLVGLALGEQHADGGVNAAQQLGAASAAMVVEWEDTRRPTEHYHFFRRLDLTGTDGPSWSVSRDVLGPDRNELIATSSDCPDLTSQMSLLESMQVGAVVAPPSTTPPSITLGPALFTVWGRNQSPEGWAQVVMIQGQAGQIADWGRNTLIILESCEVGQD